MSDADLLLKHIETTRNVLVFEQEGEIRRLNKEIERLRLTDEERDVLHGLAEDASYRCADFTERVVRGLLERLR
jgi:hypothetical protein